MNSSYSSSPLSNSSTKKDLIHSRVLINFCCYFKLEKNGIEIQTRLFRDNDTSKIILYENKYKNDNQCELVRMLKVVNHLSDTLLICNFTDIYRIVDKCIAQGKLTILIQKGQDRFSIFISKSTKELLEAFLLQLNKKNPENNVFNTSVLLRPEAPQTTNNNLITHKRKFHELLKGKTSQLPLRNKKPKLLPSNQIMEVIKEITIRTSKFKDFPDYLYYFIFGYLDMKTILSKVSLLNKELKGLSDSYFETVVIRDDTPGDTFNTLLFRFKKMKHLIFGKAKNFKKGLFKSLSSDLKQLESLDISQVQNVSDSMLKTLFSKIDGKKFNSLRLNYYIDCLYSSLVYILTFFPNLKTLEIINFTYEKHNSASLEQICKFPKYYHPTIMEIIGKILLSQKIHLNTLSLSVFNANEKVFKNKPIFQNLSHLSINLLLIEKVENMQIFYHCKNLISFRIDSIAIKEQLTNITAEPKFSFIDFSNNGIIPNENNVNVDENAMDNFSIDFDNDYLEVFGKIFYYMKDSLKYLYLGQFLNDDLCKYISIYLKKLIKISFSSEKVSDDGIKVILSECKEINEIDLEGCTRFLGSAFFDIGALSNLKKARLSIMTHNYYHVINYLKNNGVAAENFIRAKYNN